MKATQRLRDEHEGVLAMLDSVDSIARDAEAGKDPDGAEIDSILDFLRTFVDRCHHAKEEEFLFPALRAAGPMGEGPVAQMLVEHDMGRKYVAEMGEARLALGKDPAARLRFAKAARGYSELLRSHIRKENEVLFPLADRLIGAEKAEGLYADFEAVEEERIGHGRHEAFHALIEELARRHKPA
jgi:hemerythrin-like domain-containing protein